MCNCKEVKGEKVTVVVLNAIQSKLTKILDKYASEFETVTAVEALDISTETARINKALWKSMTKDEITAMLIGKNDVFTLTELNKDPRCIKAMGETRKLHEANHKAIGDAITKSFVIRSTIDSAVEDIENDLTIFGLTDEVRVRIAGFEDLVKETLGV